MISPFYDQIKANVDRCGLHIQAVFQSETAPAFTYTIGFARLHLPEVICFGLDSRMMAPFMNRYYSEIVSGLRDPGPAVLEGDDWFNHPLSVINADQKLAAEHACQAVYFSQDMRWKEPEFVQWVWCDTNGKLPWQEGYEKERFGKLQPVLQRFM